MTRREQIQAKLKQLLSDFGYEVQGNTIINKAIRGFCGPTIFGKCRDLWDATEQLCPIIHSDEYTNRLIAIQNTP